MDEHKKLRTYGRVKARTLKPRQAGLIDALLPHLAIDLDIDEIDLSFPSPRPPGSLPPGILVARTAGGPDVGEGPGVGAALKPPTSPDPTPPTRIILEIGFGGGEHLIVQAARDPDALFLGAEPFLNGVGSCLRHIEESGVANVRLHHGDARDVIDKLPPASLDRAYILFPDPWPKTRHWKRRLIQADFLTALARVLKSGAEVRFATDWKAYAAWTLATLIRAPDFEWTARGAEDWRRPWGGHVSTRYEEKKLGDCAPIFLSFRKL